MSNILKMGGSFARAGLAAAAITAATLSFATPAAAVDYVFVSSATPAGPNSTGAREFGLVIAGSPPANRAAGFELSPYILKGNNGQGPDDGYKFGNVLAFCIEFSVDMFIDEQLIADTGVNTIDNQYTVGSLSGDADDLQRIYDLVNFGTDLWRNTPHNDLLYVKLAAVQGAIWQVQTGLTFGFADGSSDTDGDYMTDYDTNGDIVGNVFIDNYSKGIFDRAVSDDAVRVIFDREGDSMQGLAYSLRTSVPEPATWGLMIGGFFVAGGMVRRNRRASVSAA